MALALIDPYWEDWLELGLRWLHVVAGIVWIGTSFYFVALDNHLGRPRVEEEGVAGESWEIHGGGFYRISKYRVAPAELPEPLHWFKWEAYTTWLSGFGLLVVLYYWNAETYLIDKSVADIPVAAAIGVSLIGLAAAWVVYDLACMVFESDVIVGLLLLAIVVGSAYGAGEVFSGRAAYLQVGAMLGTIMAANVLFNIIPAHWELIRAKEAGREPDPAPGLEAKRRSVHNNYLTLPVVFTMISNHFAFTYEHEHAWAVLVALVLIGAWIRHFFNLRHAGRTEWFIPVTAVAAAVVLAIAIRPDEGGGAPGGRVDEAKAAAIVQQRCVPCHSQNPTREGFDAPPGGIVLETREQIVDQANAVEEQAVRTKAMPLGNVTGMTDEERETLGTWLDSVE
ncbi:MAG: urate hydroxylase PuuD [Gaiellaceae bacterium]